METKWECRGPIGIVLWWEPECNPSTSSFLYALYMCRECNVQLVRIFVQVLPWERVVWHSQPDLARCLWPCRMIGVFTMSVRACCQTDVPLVHRIVNLRLCKGTMLGIMKSHYEHCMQPRLAGIASPHTGKLLRLVPLGSQDSNPHLA